MRATFVIAALLLAVSAPATSIVPASAAPAAIKTTKGQTKPVFPDQITEEYRVETKHGTMYGWVSRPDPAKYPDLYAKGQGTLGKGIPTVMVLSPYNSITQPVAGQPHVLTPGPLEYFAPRGYAFAQFDVIGTRESGGCYDYGGIRERETAAAVVDFMGTRDWSNGKVGMIGGSYDGTTQFAAAVQQPKHLAAIIPQVAIDRWYDYAYGGGVRYLLNSERPADEGFDTPFAFDFGFAVIPPSSLGPESAQVLAERINPCDRLLHTERGYELDPVYDEFWDERDYRRLAHRVKTPTFIEGGWLDHNVKHWDSTRMFMALPDDLPKKLVMGQWAHSDSAFDDAQDMRHAWFDHWLLGIDTGVMDLPPVDSQINTGTRTQLADWPPPGTRTVELPLTSSPAARALALEGGGDASYRDVDKRLTEDEALEGQCNGRCLVFVSSPLKETIRISGGPQLHLAATSSAQETQYTPVLFAQAPDGARTVISRGFLNARNRESIRTSTLLDPGERYEAPVPIWDVDHQVPAGHRVGVAVLSSNVAWALPDQATSTNTLTLAGASYLQLPLSQGAASLTPPRPTGGKGGTGGSGGSGAGGAGAGGTGSVGGAGTETGGFGSAGTLPATGAGSALVPGAALLGLSLLIGWRNRRDGS